MIEPGGVRWSHTTRMLEQGAVAPTLIDRCRCAGAGR